MAKDHLSNVDTALLQLEDPTNLMMATALMVFKAPIDFERLKATLEARLLPLDRFRQRVAWPPLGLGNPTWKYDPDFDLRYHLQRATLPPPGDQAALQDVVSLLASTPLDLSKPLWQFHLVEGYAECCALVLRFHHAIADGTALVRVILSMTESDPNPPWPTRQPHSSQRHRGNRLGALRRPARSRLRAGRRAAGAMAREGFGLLVDPSRVLDLGRTGRMAATDLARFVLLEPDPDTVLRGRLGLTKRAAWSAGIPLDDIKTIQRGLGGTVNDVLLTAVTGALRRYLQERGDPVDRISLRAAVPVNLRPPGHEGELGNRMGAVFLTLPVSIADPVSRLGEIERRMDGRKDSLEAPVIFVLLNALGMTPARIANTLVNTFGTRATAVMTNVRGPQEQLYLAGAPLDALLGWVPTTGRMGVGVSILSYAGQVRLGLLTDEGLVPDPETIIAGFHDEYEALLALAQQAEDASSSGEMLGTQDTTLEDDAAGAASAPAETAARRKEAQD
jgi:diacylglycerol O-acyltransferase